MDSGDFECDMVVGAGRASQTAAELLGPSLGFTQNGPQMRKITSESVELCVSVCVGSLVPVRGQTIWETIERQQ